MLIVTYIGSYTKCTHNLNMYIQDAGYECIHMVMYKHYKH